MIFSNLSDADKAAFFTLLDEYFSSRPGLAEALQIQPSGPEKSHLGRTPTPQSTPTVPRRSNTVQVPRTSSNSSAFASASANPDLANAIGRVAAARNSFAVNNNDASAGLNGPPRPSMRRMASSSSADSEGSSRLLPPPRTMPAPPGKATDGNFKPPPPPRRGSTVPKPRTPTPEPEPQQQGEWVEALYDFNSTDATDLPLRAGDQVLLLERTSNDWWTGELNGKSGLFPSAYVKEL